MAEPPIVNWLRDEVAKRLGPWADTDAKGQTVVQPPLCTCITLLPSQAMELLDFVDQKEEDRGQG